MKKPFVFSLLIPSPGANRRRKNRTHGLVYEVKISSPSIEKNFFTLIELLVVVAIIMILISIMLPALKKARENAILSVCMNQLHQIGVATSDYVDSYNGFFPCYNTDGSGLDPLGAALINEQAYPRSLFLCPKGENKHIDDIGWHRPLQYNYTANDRILYIAKVSGEGCKITRMKSPSTLPYLVEEHERCIDNAHYTLQSSNEWWPNMISARHEVGGKGSNMLFCDMHVEYWTFDDPMTGVYAPGQYASGIRTPGGPDLLRVFNVLYSQELK